MESILHSFGLHPKVTIVCGVHGEEVFGQRVYDYLMARRETLGSFRLILAHPDALASNVRYFQSDLNRSFPGSSNGTREEKIAADLLPEIVKADYVIDIHTTVSDIGIVPIVTNLNPGTKRLINATDSRNVALIQSSSSPRSLIGQVEAGMALEFNREVAEELSSLEYVAAVVTRLQSGHTRPTVQRRVFMVDGTLDKSVVLDHNARNLTKLLPQNVYPFLLHKESYPDIHCHTASKYQRIRI